MSAYHAIWRFTGTGAQIPTSTFRAAEGPDETLKKIKIANANLQEAINKFKL